MKLIARDLHKIARDAYAITIFLPSACLYDRDAPSLRNLNLRKRCEDPKRPWVYRNHYGHGSSCARDPWSLIQIILGRGARGEKIIVQEEAQRLLACMYEGYLPECSADLYKDWVSHEKAVRAEIDGRVKVIGIMGAEIEVAHTEISGQAMMLHTRYGIPLEILQDTDVALKMCDDIQILFSKHREIKKAWRVADRNAQMVKEDLQKIRNGRPK
jgi:hypothetical protein